MYMLRMFSVKKTILEKFIDKERNFAETGIHDLLNEYFSFHYLSY